ncbi:hypothetical protein [Calothrix sp. UHCC 0171]|uniref:hypothetical protein n=1 Tax=Calothrix sp. UHCC 0171 TaxID=3110245 RepID=UPI002B1FFF1F|nr:hypothetical protein [Calothrix sp. UHCC 0171]MEA5574099.1 hypothetical protein [Calothrix sp. UHCC 0171]
MRCRSKINSDALREPLRDCFTRISHHISQSLIKAVSHCDKIITHQKGSKHPLAKDYEIGDRNTCEKCGFKPSCDREAIPIEYRAAWLAPREHRG